MLSAFGAQVTCLQSTFRGSISTAVCVGNAFPDPLLIKNDFSIMLMSNPSPRLQMDLIGCFIVRMYQSTNLCQAYHCVQVDSGVVVLQCQFCAMRDPVLCCCQQV